jgi:adenylate kinase
MRLILLGAPGAGKGTQGALFAKKHGLRVISTGDILRDAVRRGTELGEKAKGYMDAGELVPDELILGMVREVLAGEEGGFILDGFPRTLDQAEGLSELLADLDMALDAVVVIQVEPELVVKRISGRRSCPECKQVYNVYFEPPQEEGVCDNCGTPLVKRPDDNEETVRNRLDVYERQTRPLIEYYQEQTSVPVEFVDGSGSVQDVQDAIDRTLLPA